MGNPEVAKMMEGMDLSPDNMKKQLGAMGMKPEDFIKKARCWGLFRVLVHKKGMLLGHDVGRVLLGHCSTGGTRTR